MLGSSRIYKTPESAVPICVAKTDALALAARKGGGAARQREIVEPHAEQEIDAAFDLFKTTSAIACWVGVSCKLSQKA